MDVKQAMEDISPEERRMLLEVERLQQRGNERLLELAKHRLEDKASIPAALIEWRKYKKRVEASELKKRAKKRKRHWKQLRQTKLIWKRKFHEKERKDPVRQYKEWKRKVLNKWTKAGKPERLAVLLSEGEFVNLVKDITGNYSLARLAKDKPWVVENVVVTEPKITKRKSLTK